ncbi:hypothetical protein OIDMADRAFT_17067 [Oidiodendron maius Zn]|uniref:Single-stranded DNA-binding protein n=1 Tax=Oidiodendron maius (strain Zn) TaxID=913774 RepID=A0A0C3D3S7_OIDMZ|nr:hypothetical protein OIDMADRAFT_17067 [Oidiodendron maius Zn]
MSAFLLRRALPVSARAFSTSSRASTFAKITLVGRLGDSPEVVPTSTGSEILRYNVATNSGPRDNQKTNWFRVTSFTPEGPQRDFIAGLEKGTLVYVEGSAEMNQYTDSEGKPRTALSIVQQRLDVLARKPKE